MQGSLMSRTNKLVKGPPELYANHVGSYSASDILGAESVGGEEQSLDGGDDRASSRSRYVTLSINNILAMYIFLQLYLLTMNADI